ncbi:NAD(P)-binding protein [Paraphaeosphaeria sporulosa]|uniref:NAD(P)-binding protein n=1 Tax=Paraphaeosphaeria sporulosa TaxID=1460663 RepID=A0A177CPR7_9PLEO|nr:NAD(P)-binding protein [Paraphaeosphaeria sporulosa]OAG09514.1 NAD(P)-binding protein [Paraphaeosphaeria sporulosa]
MASVSPRFDLSLGLEGTHVLVTGGCGLIGCVVVDAFLAAGANVSVLDLGEVIAKREHYRGEKSMYEGLATANLGFYGVDIREHESVAGAFERAEGSGFGPVECCVALASLDLSSLPMSEGGICDADPEVWQSVFQTNISGTFLTAQRWLRGIRETLKEPGDASRLKNVGLIIMGSESGAFGVPGCPAYAAGKAAVQVGLLKSLARDVPKVYLKGRVNAVAPGAVDTVRFREECERYPQEWVYAESEATVALAKPVPPEDVARTILFLASERWSGSTHGQLLHVDGGKMGPLVWQPGEAKRARN